MRFPALAAALVAGACLAGPAHAQPLDPFALPTEKVVLGNGLTVLLAPDPRAPLASVVVSYRAGAADDPDGLRGLAHMTEHLAGGRTAHVQDALRALAAAGASDLNAATAMDRTLFFETLPPEHLATALWIEADRMGFAGSAVTDARVVAERPVLANEVRDRSRDTSMASVLPLMVRELFPFWHPYAASSGDDLARIDARDVQAFLRTWYQPSNAILAIAGAFDRDATLASVNHFFGSLPSSPVPERPALPAWSLPGAWVRIHALMTEDHVRFAWRTPAFGTRDDAALDLAAILLAAPTGRLSSRLLALHLATAVSARQMSMGRDSVFAIDATLTAGADVALVIREIEAAVEEIARAPRREDTERAQEFERNRTLAQMESTAGRAQLLVSGEVSGESPGEGFGWGLRRHEAIDAGQVAQAVATHLVPLRQVVAVVYADGRAPIRGILVRREEVTP